MPPPAQPMLDDVADDVRQTLSNVLSTGTEAVVDAVLEHEGIDEDKLAAELAKLLGLRHVEFPVTEERDLVRKILPARVALRHRVLGLEVDEEHGRMVAAVYDPLDLLARQTVARQFSGAVEYVVASRRRLLAALQEVYGVGADTFEEILAGRAGEEEGLDIKDEARILDGDDEEASVVKFVNQIIREALEQRATDIHVEPLQENLRIRYRIDGGLVEVAVPERIKSLQSAVIARLKIMSRLDIAERRLPQDGRINLQLGGNSIDVRVATVPTVEGESVSLRLLNQERFNLSRLMMLPHIEDNIRRLLKVSNGIVLITGPTGSGKSTSLYTFLSELNSPHRRIVTIEDPVENKLDGIMQIAVRPEINLTFANGLRSILRADPNVVMIGEIRDLETAEIAIRASLTGHLVFSTLHTNDSLGGISRLTDMGVEPFLLAASVRAFLAQRLVRRLCPACKRPTKLDATKAAQAGLEITGTPRACEPVGCEQCRNTGFRGRLAIYEIAMVTKALQELITARATGSALFVQAKKDGFRPMREYGWEKVLAGETTLEEVVSATSTEVD
ncbi:MAG: GspE/PulE family protein [Verrucomicrobiales bacterium]